MAQSQSITHHPNANQSMPPRKYKHRQPNQLYRELLGINGLNFADGADSAARKQMFSSHIGQSLVFAEPTERFHQTGMEAEFGKYTYAKAMPEDGYYLKTFKRYKTSRIGEDHIAINPQEVVAYQSAEGHFGILDFRNYFSDQTYFGFEYKNVNENLALLDRNNKGRIPKGTVFKDSPLRGPDGAYKFGRECNIAYMTHHATSEDGILISRKLLDKFKIKIYERREVEWGSRYFPLNLYGDPNKPEEYKPFPDIGDRIRDDGLLIALRREEPALAAVEQSARKLRAVTSFDRTYYAAGKGGRVVDIRVHHDEYANSTLPVEFEQQVQKYHQMTREFYKEIIDFSRELHASKHGTPILTPEFHRLVYEAYVALGLPPTQGPHERVKKLHRKNPLDDWRVEFVIEYEITPNIGNKFTELHGGKGVVCAVAEEEDMPIDDEGNRAEIVMDPGGKLSRMNLGGIYEPYFNSASRDMLKKLRAMLNVEQHTPALKFKLDKLEATDPELMNRAWDWVLNYFKIVSPERSYKWFTQGEYLRRAPRTQFLSSIISHSTRGMIVYTPPENEPEFLDMVRQIENGPYKPLFGPVTYRGSSGKLRRTKRNIRIGSIYIIELEKIAKDWTAVSSGKLQHFGVLSQITSWDKYSQPTRTQPIRTMGEAEIRIYASFGGRRVTADLLDRNNNPRTRRFILDTILRSKLPTHIDRVVDRRIVPYGGNKPLQLIKHMGQCGGWEMEYLPYIPPQRTIHAAPLALH